MTTIPAAMQTMLESGQLPICQALQITKTDGSAAIGFTDHDRNLVFGGTTYYADDGITGSAMQASPGSSVDNFQMRGPLKAGRVTEAEIMLGLYTGATFLLYLANWQDPTNQKFIPPGGRGYISEARVEDGEFVFEMHALQFRLKQSIGETATHHCLAELGDARCGKDLTAFTFSRTVDSLDGNDVLFAADAHADDYYENGTVTFTSGANLGQGTKQIKSHTLDTGKARISLRKAFPFTISPGDVATLVAGCNKLPATCKDKFDNRARYRGWDFIIQNDEAVRRFEAAS